MGIPQKLLSVPDVLRQSSRVVCIQMHQLGQKSFLVLIFHTCSREKEQCSACLQSVQILQASWFLCEKVTSSSDYSLFLRMLSIVRTAVMSIPLAAFRIEIWIREVIQAIRQEDCGTTGQRQGGACVWCLLRPGILRRLTLAPGGGGDFHTWV